MEHTLQLGEILKDGMYPVESEVQLINVNS